MDIFEKLQILTHAAKYDAACTSSGVDRKAPKGEGIGSTKASGICHSFSADGRCIALLKILMSNACAYDCKYCVNRKTNDVPRATFTPHEIAELTINFYRRNYIEGLFLSSGVIGSPNYTTELMIAAIKILREEYKFYGYIHAKAIPGTDNVLIQALGLLVDRISVNIEFPSNESLTALAPDKTKESILAPMSFIKEKLLENNERKFITGGPNFAKSNSIITTNSSSNQITPHKNQAPFAPGGQATQMIIGASPETDYSIVKLTEGLYNKYKLKRVFFSAYVPVVESSDLPSLDTKPQLLREHRLYQCDWLMRVYGFKSHEILDDKNPHLNPYLDPKCNWAVNHPELFPVDVNVAPLEMLTRVPGIGLLSANKIIAARRLGSLNFADLKKLGVVLKRAQYFILCSGRTLEGLKINQNQILHSLLSRSAIDRLESHQGNWQTSMFDTVLAEDIRMSLTGQL